MKNTSIIASAKHVSRDGRDLVIITAADGAEIWVPKAQFNENAECITYESKKAGDTYIDRTSKEEKKLLKDRNEFIGFGKQQVKKYSSMELVDRVLAAGIAPVFNMG